ncbi:MAG: selenide, water dikinase [Cyclobacteriaceae bacterium]|nr:MAG: selenide, water dikinase [Cyclobacteriaceae bacterium]
MTSLKLTQFSHGAGCGCKIAPSVLEEILQKQVINQHAFPDLLVGMETRDDAAVMAIHDQTCLISTADFFMPVVDDAHNFGAIAAANALSDVYAMGGKPLMALALLGWPVEKIPAAVAADVLHGGRETCAKAGIPLAGGHSIDSPEPFFGLAVTGLIKKQNLKRNSTAKPGDAIYLTKPLGSGIIATAARRNLAAEGDLQEAIEWMKKLNHAGEQLGMMPHVSAMTDVTGFGLLGHLTEVCEGSNTSAELLYSKVPLFTNLKHYTARMVYPDNTMRNWQGYEKKVTGITAESLLTLCDPQTNGGLLVCVNENARAAFEAAMNDLNTPVWLIGRMINPGDHRIYIV